MIAKLQQTTKTTALFCVLLNLFSCAGVMKSSIKEDGEQIPPDFGKEDVTILVIQKGKRSYDKYLERNFKENYFGKYVIVDEVEVNHKKYEDKRTYRYIFDEDKYSVVNGNNGSGSIGSNVQSIYARFFLTDRLTGEIYKTKRSTGAFAAWMKAYVQALEKARQKNRATGK